MIVALVAAVKSLSVVQWFWMHRAWLKWAATGLAVAILLCLWRWERHDRVAAQVAAEAAQAARDRAQDDAKRWHDASDQRDAAIARLSGVLNQQNAAVAKLRSSLDLADRAAAQAAADSRNARAAFEQRIKELNDEAKAHPEDVVPLGGIVRGRLDRLWD
jgi:hypothetical protein